MAACLSQDHSIGLVKNTPMDARNDLIQINSLVMMAMA